MTSLGPAQFYLLLTGVGWTLLLTVAGFIFGGLGGLAVALCRTSGVRWLEAVAVAYIEIFRGTPLLLQLFIVYYGVGLLNISMSPWIAVSFAFMLHASAFLGEIWRGSIDAIPRGQTEAAKALSLGYLDRMRYVILPQAVKVSVPPTIGFLVQLIKGTSLAAIVGFTELARTGTILSNITYKPLLIYFIVGVIYFAICWPLSKFGSAMERRLTPISNH
ncbi:ABC transporter permease subunit [Agrobacterium vitis]|uniref:amino acid ABC transporter permease n=1 Tax=Agrobacterium vitis TaxID=373 RepID=UPI00132C879B|nr:ABC transporter permease subunit [Agrobacterium vitis]